MLIQKILNDLEDLEYIFNICQDKEVFEKLHSLREEYKKILLEEENK